MLYVDCFNPSRRVKSHFIISPLYLFVRHHIIQLRFRKKLQLRDVDESTVDPPTKAVEVCPAKVPEEPEYDPINEEIDKVTKLLEKVSRVRGNVKDNVSDLR